MTPPVSSDALCSEALPSVTQEIASARLPKTSGGQAKSASQ